MGKQLSMGFVALKNTKKTIHQKVNAEWKPTEHNWQDQLFFWDLGLFLLASQLNIFQCKPDKVKVLHNQAMQ